MCRTGGVFLPRTEGRELHFRPVGAIRYNVVIEDHETGSWWFQATGEAVKGPLAGARLDIVSSEQMTLGEWLALHPASDVMAPDPASDDGYRMFGFDLFDVKRPDPAKPREAAGGDKEWLVVVFAGGRTRAYPWAEVERRQVLEDELGGVPIAIYLREDGISFRVFERRIEGETLSLVRDPESDRLLELASFTRFGFDGVGEGGRLDGCVLAPVPSSQELARAFHRFRRDGELWAGEAGSP